MAAVRSAARSRRTGSTTQRISSSLRCFTRDPKRQKGELTFSQRNGGRHQIKTRSSLVLPSDLLKAALPSPRPKAALNYLSNIVPAFFVCQCGIKVFVCLYLICSQVGFYN